MLKGNGNEYLLPETTSAFQVETCTQTILDSSLYDLLQCGCLSLPYVIFEDVGPRNTSQN